MSVFQRLLGAVKQIIHGDHYTHTYYDPSSRYPSDFHEIFSERRGSSYHEESYDNYDPSDGDTYDYDDASSTYSRSIYSSSSEVSSIYSPACSESHPEYTDSARGNVSAPISLSPTLVAYGYPIQGPYGQPMLAVSAVSVVYVPNPSPPIASPNYLSAPDLGEATPWLPPIRPSRPGRPRPRPRPRPHDGRLQEHTEDHSQEELRGSTEVKPRGMAKQWAMGHSNRKKNNKQNQTSSNSSTRKSSPTSSASQPSSSSRSSANSSRHNGSRQEHRSERSRR